MSGKFEKFEVCPSCGSSRTPAFARYSDGHGWCFSCGYYEPGHSLSVERLKQRSNRSGKVHDKTVFGADGTEFWTCHLPRDFTHHIASVALDWLRRYEITDREIIRHKLGWSDYHERLIFPVFSLHGRLLLWFGRYFGLDKEEPKYRTLGVREGVIHTIESTGSGICTGERVVLVEDFVSAIKVARVETSSPLLGANISVDRMAALADDYRELVVWLDRDKATEAVKANIKAQTRFESTRTIISSQDPKEYDVGTIQDFLS